MWELDYKESWVPKNWCFWTVLLEKTLESPLNFKEIQPAHPKGDQSWVFIGRTDVGAETPILWSPHAKSWLIGKDPDAGRDWGQEEKGTTEDEMAGWHYWLNGHEFEWTPGVGDGQEGLVCCGSWGCEELDMTEQLNWTDWSSHIAVCSRLVWQIVRLRSVFSPFSHLVPFTHGIVQVTPDMSKGQGLWVVLWLHYLLPEILGKSLKETEYLL